MNTWLRSSKRVAYRKLLTALFTVVLLAQGGSAFAQGRVNQYVVTTPSLTWNSIASTGSVLTSQSTGYGWRGIGFTLSLPFAFNYDNTSISAGSTLYLSSATLGFGSQAPNYYGTQYGGHQNSSFPARLFPFGEYYCAMGDGSYSGNSSYGAGIYYQTTGSVGSRVFTIQMQSVHSPGAGPNQGAGRPCDMQIKLFEGTNVIQFLYNQKGANVNPYNYSGGGAIGINGFASPSFVYKTVSTGLTVAPSTDIQFSPPAPPGNYSLQPKSLNYGGVTTGSSLTLTTTLKCLGPSPITLQSATITGSSNYQILTGPTAPGTILTPGTSYDYQIRFTPTAAGSNIASFTVVTSLTDSATQTVVLNGSGLAPNVQYTFAPYKGIKYPDNTLFHHVALHFGDSLTEYFYVTNTGTAPLVFNNFSTFGLQSSMYKVVYLPRNPLPAGATDSIGVRFIPYLEGRPDAYLTINSNALNLPNDTVSLWGTGKLAHLVVTPQTGTVATGMSAGTLRFDSVAIGDSVCQTLALHNTGTDTLYINRQQVTYGDYDFHFYPLTKPDTMLAPDQTKLVNVCFVPVQAGARFASVRFYTNISKTYPDNRDTSQFLMQVSGTGVPYGKLAVSGPLNVSSLVSVQKCVEDTIWNTGSADLTISSVKLSGANASNFTLTPPTLPIIIPKGSYQTVQLCFTPAARGLSTATLDVTGSTSGRSQNMSLAINGTGQIGCMDATPNPVTFGSSSLPGMTMAKTGQDVSKITVKNCGDVPMTFTASSSDAHYTILSTVPTAAVAPNGTTTLDVQFAPDTIGAVNGTITITPSESSVTAMPIAMGGVGAGVYITPSGTPSATAVGQSSTFTVTLVNNGNVAWTPNAATVTGDYTVGAVSPASIPAGGTGTVTVTFAPTQTGSRTGTLSFAAPDITPLGSTLPYTFNANGTSGSGVAMTSAQDGFALGSSYPNPASTSSSVVVTTPRDAKVTVALVRLDGSQVATVFDGSLSEGQHMLNFDVTNLASGTYIYTLESGSVRLSRQMVVTK